MRHEKLGGITHTHRAALKSALVRKDRLSDESLRVAKGPYPETAERTPPDWYCPTFLSSLVNHSLKPAICSVSASSCSHHRRP
jgi:hypothetical protein